MNSDYPNQSQSRNQSEKSDCFQNFRTCLLLFFYNTIFLSILWLVCGYFDIWGFVDWYLICGGFCRLLFQIWGFRRLLFQIRGFRGLLIQIRGFHMVGYSLFYDYLLSPKNIISLQISISTLVTKITTQYVIRSLHYDKLWHPFEIHYRLSIISPLTIICTAQFIFLFAFIQRSSLPF